jgi:putative glutathione S-transferase
MLNSEFNEWAKHPERDFYPAELRSHIDEINAWVYPNINNGVYRCGFAQSQEAYNKAITPLFEHLDKAEAILSKSRYIAGDKMTEADIRLWTTLLRFDPVYYVHFKTNLKHLYEYPNLWYFQ